MKLKSNNINRGAAVFSVLFGLLFFLIFLRFLYIQITGTVDGHILPIMAEQKYSRTNVIDADRGTILDRNGIAIALDIPAYTVKAILDDRYSKDSKTPKYVVNPKEVAQKLSPILDVSSDKLLNLLEEGIRNKKNQIEFGAVGRGISYKLMQEIQSLDLPGVIFTKDTKRYYPNGKFATHVIGFARKDDDGIVNGKQGLEYTLEKKLKEENGEITKKNDRNGVPILSRKDEIIQPKHGKDVYLTIDQKIQAFLEDAMNRVDAEYEPENIIGIVADPKTGAILAMSSRPSYDPNDIPANAYMLNDAIATRFEPGSTMKIFTLATAIEEGVFNPNETYKSGTFKVGPNRIGDHNNSRGWGEITYLEGFQRSSNVAMANLVMNKMNGDDRLLKYLQEFGFGKLTGIDLPGEVNGKFVFNYPIEKVTTSFGQGTTATPIQQIQAATAIANGGNMMRPFIVHKVVDTATEEILEETMPEVVGTPISSKTASQVMDILETVVSSESGTGKAYRIEGYQIAGKTGTAQIPDPNYRVSGSSYLSGNGNYIYSFLGIAPKENPELLVYIAVKKPNLTIHQSGSQPVSSIFNSVVKNSLQYLKIKPSNDTQGKSMQGSVAKKVGIELPSFEGFNKIRALELLEKMEVNTLVLGEGNKIIGQAPYAPTNVIKDERVILMTKGTYLMPDLTNWSLRDVMKLSNLLGLKLNNIGYGYVQQQNIPPGSSINIGEQLVIELDVERPKGERAKDRIPEGDSKTEPEMKEPLN